MRLTDIITAKDIMAWLRSELIRTCNQPDKSAVDIFHDLNPELVEIRELLVQFGSDRGRVGADLQFLDAAIRYKTEVLSEIQH